MLARSVARSVRFVFPAVVALLFIACPGGAVVAAAPAPSLDLAPEDAAFYSVMLRGKEQWDTISGSHAWGKLKSMPAVQMGLGLWAMQAASSESPAAKVQQVLNDPETKKVLELVGDMFSEEVFVFGNRNVTTAINVLQRTMNGIQYDALGAQLKNQGGNPEEVKARAMMAALSQGLSRFVLPEIVIGCKVKNRKLAQEQLDLLEKTVGTAIEEQPFWKERFGKETIDGRKYLTLTLNGDMIPLDGEFVERMHKLESYPGDADKLIARVKQLTLVVAIGLRDDYLLVTISPTTDVLTKLGKGASLRTRAELAAVAKFADRRLTSIDYLSQSLHDEVASNRREIDSLLKTLNQTLPSLEIPQGLKDDIRRDATNLAKDLKSVGGTLGAITAVSFITPTGQESYLYDWSTHSELDGSKPLALVKHVGGSPWLAAMGHGKVDKADYVALTRWVATAYGYVEKYAVPQMKPEERKDFEAFAARALPLVKRFDKANRDLLLPALADGETALVLDAKLSSKQYLAGLPPTKESLPMLEPALVLGVSDAALLQKAFVEYYAIADGFVDAIRKIKDVDIPANFKLPRPKMVKGKNGMLWVYDLPKEWGVDSRIRPGAALSGHVAVLSLWPQHSERLLADTPGKVAGKPLPGDRPLCGLVACDPTAFFGALRLWVEMGMDLAAEQPGANVNALDLVRTHVHTVFDVLKVFRSSVTEMYFENKVLVTHTRSEIRDVE